MQLLGRKKDFLGLGLEGFLSEKPACSARSQRRLIILQTRTLQD